MVTEFRLALDEPRSVAASSWMAHSFLEETVQIVVVGIGNHSDYYRLLSTQQANLFIGVLTLLRLESLRRPSWRHRLQGRPHLAALMVMAASLLLPAFFTPGIVYSGEVWQPAAAFMIVVNLLV